MAYPRLIDFRSTVTGIQRASLFDVSIVFNNAGVAFDMENFRFTCKSASMPASTMGKIEVPFMGRKVEFNGDRPGGDWTTTVIVDNYWKSYKNIYNWHAAMNHPQDNVATSRNMNDFKGIGIVTAYANDGQPSFKMKLDGLFPYDLQQADWGWENTDQTYDISVTWTYDFAIMM